MLEGAARRVRNVPNSCCKGASEGCCCTLLLEGAAVRVACPLWSWPAGAAAGCGFKVLQLKRRVRFGVGMLVPLQDAAARGQWLRRKIYAHKTQVLILQMYQGSELGSLRYDSGYDSETPFLNSGSFVA